MDNINYVDLYSVFPLLQVSASNGSRDHSFVTMYVKSSHQAQDLPRSNVSAGALLIYP